MLLCVSFGCRGLRMWWKEAQMQQLDAKQLDLLLLTPQSFGKAQRMH